MKHSDFEFQHYPAERLHTRSVHSRASAEEKPLRLAILDEMLAQGGTARPADAGARIGMDAATSEALARSMAEKHVIVMDDDAVTYAYPVSGMPTAHRVTLADGRTFSSICAIDGMGTTYTFGQDITLESKCTMCGAPVRVEMSGGEVALAEPRSLHAVHADLTAEENWASSC